MKKVALYFIDALRGPGKLETGKMEWGFVSILISLLLVLVTFFISFLIFTIFDVALTDTTIKDIEKEGYMDTIPFFYLILITNASFFIPAVIFAWFKEKSFKKAFPALGFKKAPIGDILKVAFVLMLVTFIVQAIISIFMKGDVEQDAGKMIQNEASLLVFLGICIFTPIAEEAFFRGVVFQGLRSRFSFILSASIAGIIFAIGHLEGNPSNALFIFAIMIFSSIVFSWGFEKTGSLWTSILLHSAMNASAFIALTG